MLTTFHLKVRIDGKEQTFITGAKDYGEAVHAEEAHLRADNQHGEILKVAPKSSLTFVLPLIEMPELIIEPVQPGDDPLDIEFYATGGFGPL